MASYLREPLLHFVLLGAALFAADALWERKQSKSAYTIHVSPDEMQRQAAIFATENRRQPSDDDLQGLLFAHVEEQVLMREAKRIGLDVDDTIIRRRLAQKMRFLINDVDSHSVPTDAVLIDWFETNKSKFVQPEQRSFEHIFFSAQKRDTTIEADARAIMTAGIGEDWEGLGDPFIMKRNFVGVTQADVTKDFGRDFAADIFSLPNDVWSGPIASAFGLHIVRVTKTVPRLTPEFDDVRQDVKTQWREAAMRAGNTKRLKDLIDKYDVVIDE